MRLRPALVALLSLAGPLVWCATGRAQPAEVPAADARITVVWDAPQECPAKEDVEARLARLVAGSQRQDAARAQVSVSHERGGRWRAKIVTILVGATGERTLTAVSCDLLASAAVLAIAVAFDPDLTLPSAQPAPPVPVAPPAPSPEPAPAERAPPQVGPPLELIAEAWAAGDWGALPSIEPGLGLALGATLGAWSAQAYGEAWKGSTAASAERPSAGGTFQLFDAGLRACLQTGESLSVGACIGAEVDMERGDGFGVSSPGGASRAWIAPRGGLAATVRITDAVRLPVRLEALVPLGAPSFALENVGSVFRPAPVGARATAGVAVRFW